MQKKENHVRNMGKNTPSEIEDNITYEEKSNGGEELDFQYDSYRKKYTMKAEEVEDDIIEDNYDF